MRHWFYDHYWSHLYSSQSLQNQNLMANSLNPAMSQKKYNQVFLRARESPPCKHPNPKKSPTSWLPGVQDIQRGTDWPPVDRLSGTCKSPAYCSLYKSGCPDGKQRKPRMWSEYFHTFQCTKRVEINILIPLNTFKKYTSQLFLKIHRSQNMQKNQYW